MVETDELERQVEQVIAACAGEPRAALRALLVANAYLEAEVERLAEAVSRGYARGRIRRAPGTTGTTRRSAPD